MKINIDNIDRHNAAYCVWQGVRGDSVMQPHVVATLDRDEDSVTISRIDLSSELIDLSDDQVVLFSSESLTQKDWGAESFETAADYAAAMADDSEWFSNRALADAVAEELGRN